MNTAIILAGGTGARMRTNGLPKQFLSLYGKPIICYTLETFEAIPEIDRIIVPCNAAWIDHMKGLVARFHFQKVTVIPGGADRQGSVINGLNEITDPAEDDVVVIHDGVRPLVKAEIILENIRTAKEKGNAMTVKQNIETVVVTENESAEYEDFKNRKNTYTLTSPQSFRTKELKEIYSHLDEMTDAGVPLLDASLMYAYLKKPVYLVKETGLNLKITTPEDFYYLRSYLELNESRDILGM